MLDVLAVIIGVGNFVVFCCGIWKLVSPDRDGLEEKSG